MQLSSATSRVKLANQNHVIMVDDNDGDVYIARRCFQRSRINNPWLSFANGKDFLVYLDQVKTGQVPMPALVLLDINMPGMSGHDVLEQVRRDGNFADLPIFCMLTSSYDPRDKERAIRLGASGFITKPGDLDGYESFFDSLS